jgi:hypothetical protein
MWKPLVNFNYNLIDMELQKLKSILSGPDSTEKANIENAILDRLKRDWNKLTEVDQKMAIILAKRYNRENEFISK